MNLNLHSNYNAPRVPITLTSDVEGKNQRAWVMVGAGILFMGWIIGRFARSPRRKGWNEI